MNVQITKPNTHLLPQGAYASLESLQNLRYLAKQCAFGPSASKARLGGSHKSRAISRGMEFEEVRQYQPGDDIRSIDWRVTARTQITHSKRYSEEKEKPIITAVDQRRSLFFGSQSCFKSVYACHIAALINWASLHSGDRSGGIVLGRDKIAETRPVRSHKTVNQWLQQLSQANQTLSAQTNTGAVNEAGINQLLERIIHSTQTGTSIYLISDFYDLNPRSEKLLFQIARHHHIHLVWVFDQLEMALPKAQRINISNGQNITPVAIKKHTATAFEQHFIDKQNALQDLARKLRIQLSRACIQTPPLDTVKGLL